MKTKPVYTDLQRLKIRDRILRSITLGGSGDITDVFAETKHWFPEIDAETFFRELGFLVSHRRCMPTALQIIPEHDHEGKWK